MDTPKSFDDRTDPLIAAVMAGGDPGLIMTTRIIGKWAGATFPDHTSRTIAAHLVEKAMKLNNGVNGIRAKPPKEDLAGVLVLAFTLAYHNGWSVPELLATEHSTNLHAAGWEDDGSGYRHRVTAPAPPASDVSAGAPPAPPAPEMPDVADKVFTAMLLLDLTSEQRAAVVQLVHELPSR